MFYRRNHRHVSYLCYVCFKPVLNWANVCSPNILRTLRRTMIRFLIKLLVRRIWFGQSKLCFILNWLVMRCKLRPELAAADSMIENVGQSQVNSSQYTFITPHRVIQLTTISHSGSPRQGCASHKSTNKQIPSEASEEPSDTVIHFYFCFFFIHRRALLSANQRQWSSNRANVSRTCWAKLFGPEYSFVEYFQLGSRRKVGPIKNQLASPNTSN